MCRRASLLPIGALLILLLGCAASGPKFSELPSIKEGGSTLVIYRQYAFVNGGAFPYIYVDGEKRGRLLNAGYVSFDLVPGEHTIVLNNPGMWIGKEQWKFTAIAGQRHFYRVLTDLNSMQVYGPVVYTSKTVSIQEVPKEVALQELTDLKLSD